MENKTKYKITCGKCGFITHDADDMIRHLSLTQDIPEENCREKIIKVEKINNNKSKGFKAHGRTYNYEDETPAEKSKEAIKRLRSRN